MYDDSWSHVKGFQKFSLCEMIVLQQSLNVDWLKTPSDDLFTCGGWCRLYRFFDTYEQKHHICTWLELILSLTLPFMQQALLVRVGLEFGFYHLSPIRIRRTCMIGLSIRMPNQNTNSLNPWTFTGFPMFPWELCFCKLYTSLSLYIFIYIMFIHSLFIRIYVIANHSVLDSW